MRKKIKARMTCLACGFREDAEVELELGENTIVWKCPRKSCGSSQTIVRRFEPETEEGEINLPLVPRKGSPGTARR